MPAFSCSTARRGPTVLVVTTSGDLARDAFYLEQALVAAGSDGRAYAVAGVAAGDLVSWDQARLDAHTAIVLTVDACPRASWP